MRQFLLTWALQWVLLFESIVGILSLGFYSASFEDEVVEILDSNVEDKLQRINDLRTVGTFRQQRGRV